MTINVDHPIIQIEVFWDNKWIVGLIILYNMIDGSEAVVTHGRTTNPPNEPPLHHGTVTLKPEENIVAVAGRAGDSFSGFVRETKGHVFELSFIIYDASNALTRIAGPYGNPEACPFIVTANGRLVAFGGFANPNIIIIENRNIKPRVCDCPDPEDLYGLTFIDIGYRQV